MKFQDKLPIAIIVGVFLLIKIFTLPYYENVWWDSSVYVGMGKYIFSAGNSGLWESSRPLVLPIILGFFWKLGLDTILFGRIAMILISALTIIVAYLLAEKFLDRKTAILSAIFVGFSPTFFFFSSNILTDLSSAFFSLLGIYLLLRKQYFSSGISFGLAFTTRFLQLFGFAVVGLFFLYLIYRKKENVFSAVKIALGFLIPASVYFIINSGLYGNPLKPLLMQYTLTATTGWMYFEPVWYYIANMFMENLFYFFAFAGIFLILKNKGKDSELNYLSLAFLFYLFSFSMVKHKEMRFVLTFLPYMSILAAYALVSILRKDEKTLNFKIGAVAVIFLIVSIPQYKFDPYHKQMDRLYSYANTLSDNDGIWITNPAYIVYSDKKAHKLMYEAFDAKKAIELQKDIGNASHIILNTCDIPCPPKEEKCEEEKQKLMQLIKSRFKAVYEDRFYDCELYVFS